MTEDFDTQRLAAHPTLDGTDKAAVKLLTGLTDEEIEDLGGMP